MSVLAERLREAREKANLSQDELAGIAGLKSGKQNVSRWERGLGEPSISQLRTVADSMRVTVAWLLGEADLPQVAEGQASYGKVLVDAQEYIELLRRDNSRKQYEIERLSSSSTSDRASME